LFEIFVLFPSWELPITPDAANGLQRCQSFTEWKSGRQIREKAAVAWTASAVQEGWGPIGPSVRTAAQYK